MEKQMDGSIEDIGIEKGNPLAAQNGFAAETAEPLTGQALVAALQESGFVGLWRDRDDIGDSREFARRLRREAPLRAEE